MQIFWRVLLIVLCTAAGLFLVLVWPGCRRRFSAGKGARMRTFRFAHRGLHDGKAGIPENSPAAFERAVAHGFGIELDVQLTADGQVVVFHDETLKRVCGVDRRLHDCTFAELQTIALGGTQQRIPLFSEVLRAVGGRVPLIVEVKYYAQRRALCEKTAALLDAYEGDYMIESFHPLVVFWFRKNRPAVLRGILAEDYCRHKSLRFPASLLAGNLMFNALLAPDFAAYRFDDKRNPGLWLFRRCYRGQCVFWTLRSPAELAAAEAGGAVGIFEQFVPKPQSR